MNNKNFIWELKEKLPKSVPMGFKPLSLKSYFRRERIFRFGSSDVNRFLKQFERDNRDFLESINRNKEIILLEKKEEIKASLTDFQLYFFYNLLFNILEIEHDEKLKIEFLKFVIEPDMYRLIDDEIVNIKNKIEIISGDVGGFGGWQIIDIGFESTFLLGHYIRVIISEEKIFKNKRLIMVKIYPLKNDTRPNYRTFAL